MRFSKRRLVGEVGIEIIKPQNLKELCGTCCSHAVSVLAKSSERVCCSLLGVPARLGAYKYSSSSECPSASD